MARGRSPDLSIGQHIKGRRKVRDWSIRQVADRAGLNPSTWSRIERGLMGVDNRFTLAKIAEALDCAVTDLTSEPVTLTNPDSVSVSVAAPAVRQALVETDLADPATCRPRRLVDVIADAELIHALRLRDDYAGAGRLLSGVLRELHAHALGRSGPRALRWLVISAEDAAVVLKNSGYAGETWLAAERCYDAARELDDPIMLGLAAWIRGQAALSCGSYSRALRLAESALADLDAAEDAPGRLELLGMTYLMAAFAAHDGSTRGRLLEAERIAERTGETDTLGLAFGPTNVNLWRVAIETDTGDPGRAIEISRITTPGVLRPSRASVFHVDTGRALAQLGQDDAAVRQLLSAERLAPQRIRVDRNTRETTRTLLPRATGRRAGQLRGLAQRIGVLQRSSRAGAHDEP